MKRDMKELFTW